MIDCNPYDPLDDPEKRLNQNQDLALTYTLDRAQEFYRDESLGYSFQNSDTNSTHEAMARLEYLVERYKQDWRREFLD